LKIASRFLNKNGKRIYNKKKQLIKEALNRSVIVKKKNRGNLKIKGIETAVSMVISQK